MPRIDPSQLLKCLSVLLAPSGAIKSRDEVQRIASLMSKFSKKLVSKIIYIQILKSTDAELLDLFMDSNGWNLVYQWLVDGMQSNNWPLIEELLALLLMCPMNVERLKQKNYPKLIMDLTRESSQPDIQHMANKLRDQWLSLIKSKSVPNVTAQHEDSENMEGIEEEPSGNVADDQQTVKEGGSDSIKGEIPVLKISVKDGKQVVSKMSDKSVGDKKHSSDKHNNLDKENKKKDSDKKRESDKHKSGSSSSSHSSSGKSSKSKHSSSERSHGSDSKRSGDIHKSSSKSSKEKERRSSSSSKDGEKSRDRKPHDDKDRHSSKDSDKSKASSDKKRESSDKTKESSSKHKEDGSKEPVKSPMSIMKLGKIPKKVVQSEDAKKEKPSLSVEVRKPTDQNRPKTVKMFNSKFRSHGLEEEAKPPPPRGTAVKKPAAPTPIPAKRPSPVRTLDAPPEKKPKIAETATERPGAIKLIPPKPKPSYLLDGGSFMDALTASATTNKKDAKKRKRKLSASKDDSNSSANNSASKSPPTSPNDDKSATTAPPRFYKDTLETDEEQQQERKAEDDDEAPAEDRPVNEDEGEETSTTPKIDSPPARRIEGLGEQPAGGLKGVLRFHKRGDGPKRSIRWRDAQLEDVQYFELDETERVNVTKTFLDMKQMEHTREREAIKNHKVRSVAPEDDLMEERIPWRKLIPCDAPTALLDAWGKGSSERDAQAARQARILQAMYFHRSMVPDAPAEPDHEVHATTDPQIIPLDDVTGNPDTVNDYTEHPWPEPKRHAPPASTTMMPPMQQQPMMMMPPHMMQQRAPFHQQQQQMGGPPFGYQQQMPPFGGFGAPDWMQQSPEAMLQQQQGYPPGYNQAVEMVPPPLQNGYYNGPNPQYNGGMNRGGGGGRGGGRGPPHHNQQQSWRSDKPPQGGGRGGWAVGGPPRGGGRNRLCTHYQKRGYCNKGNACPFVHANPEHY